MPPSLKNVEQNATRPCADLVWIVLSCQAFLPESTHDLAHLAQHFVSDGACFTLTFNCPIQISNFFHKTSTVRFPLPAHLIKSMDIEKILSRQKHHMGHRGDGLSLIVNLGTSCKIRLNYKDYILYLFFNCSRGICTQQACK